MRKDYSFRENEFIELCRVAAEKVVFPENLIDVLKTLQNLKCIEAFEVTSIKIKIWLNDKSDLSLKFIVDEMS